MPETTTGLVEEYKSLREEIMRRQDARLFVLGFTVTGIGTVMGLTLNGNSLTTQGLNYFALALLSFALVMLIAALLLTIDHTQQIDVISAYISIFIEPNVKGIHWESRWADYRRNQRLNPKSNGLPLGTSKPLAMYYACLTLAVYFVSFVTGLEHYWPAISLLSALVVFSLTCSLDLYRRKTRGWKLTWDQVAKQRRK